MVKDTPSFTSGTGSDKSYVQPSTTPLMPQPKVTMDAFQGTLQNIEKFRETARSLIEGVRQSPPRLDQAKKMLLQGITALASDPTLLKDAPQLSQITKYDKNGNIVYGKLNQTFDPEKVLNDFPDLAIQLSEIPDIQKALKTRPDLKATIIGIYQTYFDKELNSAAAQGEIEKNPYNADTSKYNLPSNIHMYLNDYKNQKQQEDFQHTLALANAASQEQTAIAQNRLSALSQIADITHKAGNVPDVVIQSNLNNLLPNDVASLSNHPGNSVDWNVINNLSEKGDLHHLQTLLNLGHISPLEAGTAYHQMQVQNALNNNPRYQTLLNELQQSEPAGLTPDEQRSRKQMLGNSNLNDKIVHDINKFTEAQVLQRKMRNAASSQIIKQPLNTLDENSIDNYRLAAVANPNTTYLDAINEMKKLNDAYDLANHRKDSHTK